jgi:hypothetical protein
MYSYQEEEEAPEVPVLKVKICYCQTCMRFDNDHPGVRLAALTKYKGVLRAGAPEGTCVG